MEIPIAIGCACLMSSSGYAAFVGMGRGDSGCKRRGTTKASHYSGERPGSFGEPARCSMPSSWKGGHIEVKKGAGGFQVWPCNGQVFDLTLGDCGKWRTTAAMSDGLYLQWSFAIDKPIRKERAAKARAAMLSCMPPPRRAVLECVIDPKKPTAWIKQVKEGFLPLVRKVGGEARGIMVYVPLETHMKNGGAESKWDSLMSASDFAACSKLLGRVPIIPMVMPQHWRETRVKATMKDLKDLGDKGMRDLCLEVPVPCSGWVRQGLVDFVRWIAENGRMHGWILMYPARPEMDITVGAMDALEAVKKHIPKGSRRVCFVPANYDERDHEVTAAPERSGGKVANSNTGAALALLSKR